MSDRPRQILFVLANGGRGGMQSQVRLIAASLAARGHGVTVAVGGADLDPIMNVKIIELPTFSSKWPVPFALALRRAVRSTRAQIVHAHGLRLAPIVRWSGAARNYVTCHGLDPLRAATTLRVIRHLRVEVIACGVGPQQLLTEYGIASTIINNAVATSPLARSASDARGEFQLVGDVPIVVLPARYSEQKNHRALVAALRTVHQRLGPRRPEVLCFGDGPLFDEITSLSKIDGDRPLIRCLAYRPDAAAWLSAADFFVLPSRWEGQPLVVLEAMAHGLSILTTTPTGVDDLVVDGRNGRRVKGVAAMAEVIISWIDNPSQRPVDQDFNDEILQRHSVSAVSDAYLSHYLDAK